MGQFLNIFAFGFILSCSLAYPEERDAIVSARERAAQLEEVRAMLSDPDPLMRLAFLEAIAASDDPTAKRIAGRLALTSDDPELRHLALRLVLQANTAFILTLIPSDSFSADLEHNEKTSNRNNRVDMSGKWRDYWLFWRNNNGEITIFFKDLSVENGTLFARAGGLKSTDWARVNLVGFVLTGNVGVSYTSHFHKNCNLSLDFSENLNIAGEIYCDKTGKYNVKGSLLH